MKLWKILAIVCLLAPGLKPLNAQVEPGEPVAAYGNTGSGWAPMMGTGMGGSPTLPGRPVELFCQTVGVTWVPCSGTAASGAVPGSFTLFVSAGTIYAINDVTGQVAYSNTDLTPVMTSIMSALPSGGRIFFKNGIYNINSLVAEPSVNFAVGTGVTTGAGTTIDYSIGIPGTCAVTTTICQWEIDGESTQSFLYGSSGSTGTVNQNGVILNVTSTALSSVTAGNMIVAVWAHPDLTTGLNYQGSYVIMHSIGVRFPDNQRGNEEWFDLSGANFVELDNLVGDTNTTYYNMLFPVQGTLGSYGLATPHGNMAGSTVTNSWMIGPYVGFDARGENSVFSNDLGGVNAECLDIGQRISYVGAVFHGMLFDHMMCAETAKGVTFGTSLNGFNEIEFEDFDFEDANPTNLPAFQPVYHFKETNPGTAWGNISITRTIAAIGNVPIPNPFDGGGGNNFRVTNWNGSSFTGNTSLGALRWQYGLAPLAADYLTGSGALGANWATNTHISRNAVGVSTDGTAGNQWTWNTAAGTFTNGSSSVTVVEGQSINNWMAATVRQTDVNNFYGCYAYSVAGSNRRDIIKTVAGTSTTLASDNLNAPAGSVITCQAIGTTISMLVNGVQILSATDASLSSGYAGFGFDGAGANNILFNWSETTASTNSAFLSNATGVAELSVDSNSGSTSFGSGVQLKDEGQCTMASGACTAQTLSHTYTIGPYCTGNWSGTGTLTGLLKFPSTTSSVTPTSSVGTDSAQITWTCFGK